jgi:hypothetical protein
MKRQSRHEEYYAALNATTTKRESKRRRVDNEMMETEKDTEQKTKKVGVDGRQGRWGWSIDPVLLNGSRSDISSIINVFYASSISNFRNFAPFFSQQRVTLHPASSNCVRLRQRLGLLKLMASASSFVAEHHISCIPDQSVPLNTWHRFTTRAQNIFFPGLRKFLNSSAFFRAN